MDYIYLNSMSNCSSTTYNCGLERYKLLFYVRPGSVRSTKVLAPMSIKTICIMSIV